jgi:hypothetical protein
MGSDEGRCYCGFAFSHAQMAACILLCCLLSFPSYELRKLGFPVSVREGGRGFVRSVRNGEYIWRCKNWVSKSYRSLAIRIIPSQIYAFHGKLCVKRKHRVPCQYSRLRDTLYPQNSALTSPTSGGRSACIVRSRTEATELLLLLLLLLLFTSFPIITIVIIIIIN